MALPLNNFNVGDFYESRNFGTMQVIEDNGSRDVSVKFMNTGTVLRGLQRGNVIRGSVKDIFVPSIEGVGFLGTSRNVSRTSAYKCWKHMIVRCYNENYHSCRETYTDCEVVKEWHNFTTFEKWFELNHIEGYHLDKDLLVQGNRLYSPETCCFIPAYINSLIVERCKSVDGCEIGVTKRRKKGSQEYNGLYNVTIGGTYLARTRNLEEANSLYKEFKALLFEEVADKYEECKMITSDQAEKLRKRVIK